MPGRGSSFYPKMSDFVVPGGGRILVVGSGNLTPGGLRGNFEGCKIIRTDPGDQLDVDVVASFLERHVGCIRRIDAEVLERTAQNTIAPGVLPPLQVGDGAGVLDTRVLADARRGEVEIRPCVYSEDSNKNYKIESVLARAWPDRPLLQVAEAPEEHV